MLKGSHMLLNSQMYHPKSTFGSTIAFCLLLDVLLLQSLKVAANHDLVGNKCIPKSESMDQLI